MKDRQFTEKAQGLKDVVMLDTKQRATLKDTIEHGMSFFSGFSIDPGSLVCIKPNLTTGKSAEGSAITTPVDIVDEVISHINKATGGSCDIAIVESDSDGRIEDNFLALGYDVLPEKHSNVRLVDLGKEKSYKVIMPDWSKARMIEVPEILLSMNHLINVANLKRHVQERVTMNWKNVYGLPSNHLVRMRYHQFMKEILLDLNYLFWPDLSIIDARVGLAGTGPMTGYPMPFDKIIIGNNPLVTDMAAMKLIGESHRKVPVLKYAARKLRIKEKDIVLKGDEWESSDLPFVSPVVFFMTRFGLCLRRFASYFENLSLLSWLVGIALRMGKPSEFAGGGTQSLGTSIKVALKFMRTVDLSEKVYE